VNPIAKRDMHGFEAGSTANLESRTRTPLANPSQRAGMQPEEALQFVMAHFPFEQYIDAKSGGHLNVARSVLRHLAPGAKILDFGSGPCDKAAVLQAMGFECFAYDDLQDAWHVKSGNQAKIRAFAEFTGVRLTLARPGTPLPYPKEYFDMVMLNDVIEHFHDSPRELLNDLLEVTTPNGLVLVTVPNAGNVRKRLALMFGRTNYQEFDFYYWHPGHWRGHVREYVKDDLRRLSGYLNLEMLELHGCDHMLQRVSGKSLPFYLGMTKVMNSWKDSWLLVARKQPGWNTLRVRPPEVKLLRPITYLYGE